MKDILKTTLKKIDLSIELLGNHANEYSQPDDGNYFKGEPRKLAHIYCWTQGFWTGMAGLAYAMTMDVKYLKWLNSLYNEFYDKVHKYKLDTMHDLGFLYSPYAVMLYKMTGDTKMKELGLAAADCLAMRYIPNGRYIKAWNRMDGVVPDYVDSELAKDCFFSESDGVMIIDCMMNLPLLFWASEVSGHPFYEDIAKEHIKTATKYLIREDYSVIHAYRFDTKTGEALCAENFCGYGVDTYWARGAAWMIYGLAIAYKYTYNEEYLDLFEKLTQKFVSSCRDDKMPVWDFKLPEDKLPQIDTSAASIVSCAIHLYEKYRKNSVFSQYATQAIQTLKDKFFNNDENVVGLISECDGISSYSRFGDYYFLEAMAVAEMNFEIFW